MGRPENGVCRGSVAVAGVLHQVLINQPASTTKTHPLTLALSALVDLHEVSQVSWGTKAESVLVKRPSSDLIHMTGGKCCHLALYPIHGEEIVIMLESALFH